MGNHNGNLSRRRFIGTTLTGITGITILPLLTGFKNRDSAEKEIKLGFIGLGQQGMGLLNGFIKIPGVTVLAGCDVYGRKRIRFQRRVNAFYSETNKTVRVETYERYQDLLKRKDIDAVIIATPDHAHAMVAIAACKSGKDVYLEKPLTFTIKEGQELRKVVREKGRILAVGSQQRSDPNFQNAVKIVQSGALGKITLVNAHVGPPPKINNLPVDPVPPDLNWDLWLGPLPENIPFNNELNPPISLDPEENEKFWGGWRWYKGTGGGYTTDWGAHMFDIAQWGLGMDKSGPVEISPLGDGTRYMTFKYSNGTIMTSEPYKDTKTLGVKFWGEKGWIEVSRGYFNASDPKFNAKSSGNATDANYELRVPHTVNFIESIRSRKDPVVPVETGHRSCTVCNLGNIACELKRTIKWDPAAEVFVDDLNGEATKLLHYRYRKPWKLV